MTINEFKAIVNRQDMSKEDRNKLLSSFNNINEVTNNVKEITTVDLTIFFKYARLDESNMIDFQDDKSYDTINRLFSQRDINNELYKDTAVKEFRKILKAVVKNLLGLSNYIPTVNSIIIGKFFDDYYVYGMYTGTMNVVLVNSLAQPMQDEPLALTTVNGLFYETTDCNIAAPAPLPKGILYEDKVITNRLLAFNITIKLETLLYALESGELSKLDDDEFIANFPFICCVDEINLSKSSSVTEGIHLNYNVPISLNGYEIRNIMNDEDTYFVNSNLQHVRPWNKRVDASDYNNIGYGEIYLPKECGVEKLTITNNEIVEIITSE